MFDLKNLNNDYFDSVDSNEILGIRELSFDDKVTCFKFFLTSDHIKNISVLANIFLMIKGVSSGNIFEEDKEQSFFNDIEEYVDIKLDVNKELQEFYKKLVIHYLGVIEGLSVNIQELKYHIPNTYFNILSIMTPELISKIFVQYLKKVDVSTVKPAECADKLYLSINKSDTIALDFISNILSDLNITNK